MTSMLEAMNHTRFVRWAFSHYLAICPPEYALQGAQAMAMQQVSDRLLLLSVVVLMAGVISAWLLNGTARTLVVASLAVFCLEFLMPVVAGLLPGGAIYLAVLGPALRVGIALVALGLSVLATRRVLA